MLARSTRRMTGDQFLKLYEGLEGRYELIDGHVYAMAGGSATHARVSRNIIAALTGKLRGTGCQPFGSDMALRVSEDRIRYHDIGVYCDPRDLSGNQDEMLAYRFPKLLLEVLSPSTAVDDRGEKVVEYKKLDSLQAIVLVDPLDRTIELHERVAPNEWRHVMLPPESGLTLRDPMLELSFHEIFASE